MSTVDSFPHVIQLQSSLIQLQSSPIQLERSLIELDFYKRDKNMIEYTTDTV